MITKQMTIASFNNVRVFWKPQIYKTLDLIIFSNDSKIDYFIEKHSASRRAKLIGERNEIISNRY